MDKQLEANQLYDADRLSKGRKEAAIQLAAMIQDDYSEIYTKDHPYMELANRVLPKRAKQLPEDREIL